MGMGMGQFHVEGKIEFPCILVTHFLRLMALGYEMFNFNIREHTTHLGMYQRIKEFCLLVVYMLQKELNLFIQMME